METNNKMQQLSSNEMFECNGGGFAYDVGCVIGFIVRSAEGTLGYGMAKAYTVWFAQHPE
jgi:hypothetical protein